MCLKLWLVGGWTTHLQNMLVKLDHFPMDRGENKKYLKPPPRWVYPSPNMCLDKKNASGSRSGSSIFYLPNDGRLGSSIFRYPSSIAKKASELLFSPCGSWVSQKGGIQHSPSMAFFKNASLFQVLLCVWLQHAKSCQPFLLLFGCLSAQKQFQWQHVPQNMVIEFKEL